MYTKEDIERMPDIPQRKLFLTIYAFSPTLGIAAYTQWIAGTFSTILSEFIKKDYFAAIVCNPDDKELAIVAHGEDYHELLLKMIDTNAKGWPQTIINSMEIQRSQGDTDKQRDLIVNFLLANGMNSRRSETDFWKLNRLMYEIAVVNHEELVRRGSPFKNMPSYETFEKMTRDAMPTNFFKGN